MQLLTKAILKHLTMKLLNKPGFLEIVPYVDNTGDYPKVGNPNLKDACC